MYNKELILKKNSYIMKKSIYIIIISLLLNFYLSAQIMIHENNFETELTWDEDYTFIDKRENFTHQSTGGFNDSGYIRIHVVEGEHFGGSLKYIFKDNDKEEPKELYAQYKVYYEFSMDEYWGKAPGFDGTREVAGWGNKRSDGTNGWSARGTIFTSSTQISNRYYVYHKNQNKDWGDPFYWSVDGNMTHGKWYTVDQYIRVNDVGDSNGLLFAWVDGVHVAGYGGLTFTTTADNDFDKVYSYWINYYHGGQGVTPKDGYIRIDDLKLSTQPITLSLKKHTLDLVDIYPNPVQDKLIIKGVNKLLSISVFSINGSLLFTTNPNLKTIDVSRLQTGLYFVKLISQNGCKSIKFLKK